jgi:DNA (cytosine-5)-methyltransferase 1
MNYYNEFDQKAAAWLRELINQGLIPKGDVDTRSITEVKPHELKRYTQCHFFAGIGGWSYALQLAGWSADKPVWTGSCPCQPFSTAGKGLAQADERHLWPVFFDLIKECRPEYVFGEQVANAISKGWLDGISTDLGEEGYACGSAVLGAHSLSSPHIRQRLYWVAYDTSAGLERAAGQELQGDGRGLAWSGEASGYCGGSHSVADERWQRVSYADDCHQLPEWHGTDEPGSICSLCGLDYTDECTCPGPTQDGYEYSEFGGVLYARGLANSNGGRCEQPDKGEWGVSIPDPNSATNGAADTQCKGREGQPQPMLGTSIEADRSEPEGFWSNYTIIPCRDEKTRRIPTESSIFGMVDGIPEGVDFSWLESGFPLAGKVEGRVSLLKGYGNAIVPQVAAEFVGAFMEGGVE